MLHAMLWSLLLGFLRLACFSPCSARPLLGCLLRVRVLSIVGQTLGARIERRSPTPACFDREPPGFWVLFCLLLGRAAAGVH